MTAGSCQTQKKSRMHAGFGYNLFSQAIDILYSSFLNGSKDHFEFASAIVP
jgi:hypothetical protein